jgi:hypothetical protein
MEWGMAESMTEDCIDGGMVPQLIIRFPVSP